MEAVQFAWTGFVLVPCSSKCRLPFLVLCLLYILGACAACVLLLGSPGNGTKTEETLPFLGILTPVPPQRCHAGGKLAFQCMLSMWLVFVVGEGRRLRCCRK
jgi:hypothetical protein